MKSEAINIRIKKDGLIWVIISALTFSIYYFQWCYEDIVDAAQRDIINSQEYLLLIPIYLVFYGIGFFFLKRFLIKGIGNVSILMEESKTNISYNLYGFGYKKKYGLEQIKKLRIVDKGNMIYQVAFNYGPNENYVGIGKGYSEPEAINLHNQLSERIKT